MGQPEKHKLHHSYIWLGSFAPAPYIFIACLISFGPSAEKIIESVGFLHVMSPVLLTILASLLFTVLVSLIVLVFQAWGYRYIWYEFDPTEFTYYSGIFSKRRNHVPYQRVQSVNQKASLIQRLLGVCSVAIETAGGANNKAITIRYVEKSAAETLRRELFLRKQLMASGLSPEEAQEKLRDMHAASAVARSMDPTAAPVAPWDLERQAQAGRAGVGAAQASNILDIPAEAADDIRGIFGGEEVDTGQTTYEYGLSNKELALSAVSGKSSVFLALVGALYALSSAVSMAFDADIISRSAVNATVSGLATSASPAAIALIASMVVGGLAAIWVIMVLGTCISYGGFKARRRGNRIEVEYGIINHTFNGMDIDRIQSVEIRQSLFQRFIGCCSLSYGRIAAAAEDGSGNENPSLGQERMVVHPFCRLSDVYEVVKGLTPEHASLPECDRPIARCALRRALIRRVIWQGMGFWLALCITAAWVIMELTSPGVGAIGYVDHRTMIANYLFFAQYAYIAAVLIAVFEGIAAVLWYRRSAFGFDRDYVVITNAGYSMETVFVPRKKLQMSNVRTNPFQRHSRVATINAVTAAGVGGKKERLIDVSRDDAIAWMQWSIPGGNR